jgi:hypothetical protein
MIQSIAMLIEASGIQEYVFGSNELAQNIGASELVTQATTDWLFAEKQGLLPRPHNASRAKPGDASRWQLSEKSLADGLAAEVIYAGGGNALILFVDDTAAKAFSFKLASKAVREAPGLRLVLAKQAFEPGQLAAAVTSLHDKIAEQKRAPRRTAPLLGLGVTAACVFTGAPAIGFDKDGRYVSIEVAVKQQMGASDGLGNQRLIEYLGDVRRQEFGFVYDFDKLGLRDESSYLAVVHTDGNRMGERIGAYAAKAGNDDRAYVIAQRKFSAKVQEAAHAALVSAVGLLLAPGNLILDPDEKGGRWRYKIGGKVPVPLDGGEERLPFRPIVFGGDDVTFVCEGRLGLPLAAHYLTRLTSEVLPDGDPLYARAGIAIVKTHYPFARAYALAEELCASAKKSIQKTDPDTRRLSALDWHFATTGLVQPLKDLREREYQLGPGENAPTLLMRPLGLGLQDSREWRSWDVFCEITNEFLRTGGQWAGRRNKIKALREALRSGPDAVRLLLRSLPDQPKLPVPGPLRNQGDAATTGWQGSICTHFDAVEALDFNVPLGEM